MRLTIQCIIKLKNFNKALTSHSRKRCLVLSKSADYRFIPDCNSFSLIIKKKKKKSQEYNSKGEKCTGIFLDFLKKEEVLYK